MSPHLSQHTRHHHAEDSQQHQQGGHTNTPASYPRSRKWFRWQVMLRMRQGRCVVTTDRLAPSPLADYCHEPHHTGTVEHHLGQTRHS
ncbi:hypothetical protein E2C01_025596 [Portunus trituberculatus]|uniref:Uncharacterized protein n=1 Tax=Portunus trituberculatus TaxID=210409 RepID=A0A5B7EFP9_PORTR|nr:hypothetical protein [Portunus trituberculatus]